MPGGVMKLVSTGATATLAQWQTALRAVSFTNGQTDLANLDAYGEIHAE